MGIELPEPNRSPNGIRLEVVRDFDELQKHAEAWNRLAAETGPRPVLSYAWIATHLETRLNPGDIWFCLLAYDRHQLVGVLPIVTVPRRWPGERKCLRFETPYDIFNTSAVETLLRRGYQEDIFPLFLNYLWSIPCVYCCLHFRGVPGARLPDVISRRLCRGSTSVTDLDGYESFLSVTGGAEDYFNTLSDNFRQHYRQTTRRIQELPGTRFRFESGRAESNAEQFMSLDHQDWTAFQKTSIGSDESYVKFFRLLTRRMEEQGWLRWAFLDIGGEPAAGQFMVQSGGVLYVLQTSCNDKFSALSPGLALFGRVIEEAFESADVQVINFISSQLRLKDWNVKRLPVAHIAFFPAGISRWGLCKWPVQMHALLCRIPFIKKFIRGISARLFRKAAV
jgi:hypothetical protein